MDESKPKRAAWRARLHEIIFEADTFAGKAFDVALLFLILVSILAVLLESVAEIALPAHGEPIKMEALRVDATLQ